MCRNQRHLKDGSFYVIQSFHMDTYMDLKLELNLMLNTSKGASEWYDSLF